jgi:hypothetical protein
MKGPMTTQSLRGLADAGPMHWRGDRSGANDPGGSHLDEVAAFTKFNAAFTGLQGRAAELDTADMQAFTDYMLTLRYPPNPIKLLTNADTAAEAAGRNLFLTATIFGGIFGNDALGQACQTCHTIPLTTSAEMALAGLNGTTQEMKNPHLRNLYQKVGMFGVGAQSIPNSFLNPNSFLAQQLVGDQVRGFAFSHDGSVSTIFAFLNNSTFAFPSGATGMQQRRDLEAFMLAIDTGLRPVVGQQATLGPTTVGDPALATRLDLLVARADAGDCDLVVKGRIEGELRGLLYAGADSFVADRVADPPRSAADLAALAGVANQELTFTCVPPGSGTRIALDRDEDAVRDGDDRCPVVADADQADVDGDGVGDACDTICANGEDDDGDGFIDWPADPGCHDFAGARENPACDDDLDNDGDGMVDWDGGTALAAPDPHCAETPHRNSEKAASACGVGAEIALVAIGLRLRLRHRRSGLRRRRRADW